MDNSAGPVWPSRRRCFGLCALTSVLRFSFSEDCASEVESEHWCGAAKRTMVHYAAEYAFLFQFCTPAVRVEILRKSANCYVQVVDRVELTYVKPALEVRETTPKFELYRH